MDLIGPFFSLLLIMVTSTIVYLIGSNYCQGKLNLGQTAELNIYYWEDRRAEDSQEITQDDSPPLAEWSNSAKTETPLTADASTQPEKYTTKVYSFNPVDLHRQYAFTTDSPSDVLVFIHIQKTGGTTFGKNLIQNLEVRNPCECEVRPGLLHCPCYASDHKKQWLFSRYSTGWMCGLHADLTEWNECLAAGKADQIEGFHRDRRYLMMTVIREPTSRYISEYLHVSRGATWSGAQLMCNGESPTEEQWPFCYTGDDWSNAKLPDFIQCPYNLANNRQTRMLANLSLVDCYDVRNLNDSSRKQVMLQSAMDNLKNLAFFSIHGYPNETQLLFEHAFNIKFKVDLAEGIKPKTIHKSSDYFDFLKPDIKEHIRQVNDLDIKLFEFAKQLFLARVEYVKRLKSPDNHLNQSHSTTT